MRVLKMSVTIPCSTHPSLMTLMMSPTSRSVALATDRHLDVVVQLDGAVPQRCAQVAEGVVVVVAQVVGGEVVPDLVDDEGVDLQLVGLLEPLLAEAPDVERQLPRRPVPEGVGPDRDVV